MPAILQIDAIDTKLMSQMEITATASVNLDILGDNENRIYLTLEIESKVIILDRHVFTVTGCIRLHQIYQEMFEWTRMNCCANQKPDFLEKSGFWMGIGE